MRECGFNSPFDFLNENKAHGKIKDGHNMASYAIDVQNIKIAFFPNITFLFSIGWVY